MPGAALLGALAAGGVAAGVWQVTRAPGQRRLGSRAGRGGRGRCRGGRGSGPGRARPPRPRPADARACTAALGPALRRADRRPRSRGPLPALSWPRCAASPGGDRHPGGGVRPRPDLGLVGAVGRRRRPARRAARAVPARPGRAGAAGGPAGAAVLLAGYARTAETQQLVRARWLHELAADRTAVRHAAPRVEVTADADRALARDPAARAARLPHEVFTAAGRRWPQGPVLMQVPRAGYRLALVCQDAVRPCLPALRRPAASSRGGRGARLWLVRPPHVDWAVPDLRVTGGCGRRWSAPSARPRSSAGPSPASGAAVGGRAVAHRRARRPAPGGRHARAPSRRPTAGYAGAVLLDTACCCSGPTCAPGRRPAPLAGGAVALVRRGADGGPVHRGRATAPAGPCRLWSALTRRASPPASWPSGREADSRRRSGWSPVEGGADALAEFARIWLGCRRERGARTGAVGRAVVADEPVQRLTLRAPRRGRCRPWSVRSRRSRRSAVPARATAPCGSGRPGVSLG